MSRYGMIRLTETREITHMFACIPMKSKANESDRQLRRPYFIFVLFFVASDFYDNRALYF
jgi:hypothetical protein